VDNSAQSNPATYNVKDLPRRNGLPVLPLINSAPARPTAQPPLKENYGANGQPKVAIQAGHWLINQLPDELASLRTQTGGAGGGVREVDYVLDLSKRVVKLLQDKGIEAELLPATVPVDYTADAFVAIHADAVDGGGPGGYKLARSRFSAIPATDDALMNALYDAYGKATALRRDSNITRNMTGYYAFNNRRHVHGITRATPGVILETGYLTNASDRAYLTTHQDEIAQGIVDGIMDFLNNRPPLELREKAATTVPAVEVKQDNTVVLSQPDGAPLAYVAKGQRFEFFDTRGDYYSVRLPVLNKTGFLAKADVTQITLPR
jgi:N-acetylmuramoyl-L-alanine amidase